MAKGPQHDHAVGVVIIGRNESARLADCLGSVAEYRGRIIYADSASTDGSLDIAQKLGAVAVNIDGSTDLTPARGRNEGFAALMEWLPNCEFVQFVDGDSQVEPGWIETAAAFLATNKKAAVVCGHVLEQHPDSSIYNWLCSVEWKGIVGQIDVCGGNAMVRVAALREAGGFRGELIAGEEAELMARMRCRGWEVWRIDVPMVVHDADIQRFGDWWRRARRGGYSYANLWWLTRRTAEPLYAKQLRSSLLWVVGLPVAIFFAGASFRQSAVLLLLPIALAAQLVKMAARQGLGKRQSWTYAALLMLAKVPEVTGALRYFVDRVRPRADLGGERIATRITTLFASGELTFGLRENIVVALTAVAVSILGALLIS